MTAIQLAQALLDLVSLHGDREVVLYVDGFSRHALCVCLIEDGDIAIHDECSQVEAASSTTKPQTKQSPARG